MERLTKVTLHLIGLAQSKGPEVFLADSTLYLEFSGSSASPGNGSPSINVQKALSRNPSGPMRTSIREDVRLPLLLPLRAARVEGWPRD